MNRLHISVTCARCGGSLTNVNNAKSSALDAVAVLACVPCRAHYSVRIHMVDLGAEQQYRTLERQRNVETRRELERVAS